MEYSITHRTTYRYASPVTVSQHLAHLRPRSTSTQQLVDFVIDVRPTTSSITQRTDYYGNTASVVTVEIPHRELTVTARSRISVSPQTWPTSMATPSWETVRDACHNDVLTPDSDAAEFLFESPFVASKPAFADYARESFTPNRPLLDGLQHFNARIFHDFRFDPRATTVATPIEQVFRQRRGVCQDFAHLGIACLRSIGLPARYVSGYLETVPPPGKPRLVGSDVSHAWIAVWCSGFGWIDVDPTNNVLPSGRHITTAWGRDFGDVTPLRGVIVGGAQHALSVGIDVMRV